MESIDRLESDYLPKCWNDDVRMNFLMLEFRPQNVNPLGYEEKMSFWIDSIKDWSRVTKTVVFTHEDVCRAFERKKHHPECLQTVLDEMRKKKMLVTIEEFSSGERGWVGWTFDLLVKKPMLWSWSAALNVMKWKSQPQRYVNVAVLKDIASDVMRYHYEGISCEWTDHIVILEDLYNQCKNMCGSFQTFQLVLQQLEREKQIQIFEVDTRKVVKFRRKEESTVGVATELDVELQRLLYAKDVLDTEIERLNRETESLRMEAKQILAKGQKDKASLLLKKKKRLEIILKKKLAAYDNLENLFNTLHQSKSQKAVLQAYQSGVQAFKRLHAEEGLSLNTADTTMAEVEEALEDQAEIESTISRPVGFDTGADVTESDLELELEEILQKDVKEPMNNTEDIFSKLKVPNEGPSRPSTSRGKHRMDAVAI